LSGLDQMGGEAGGGTAGAIRHRSPPQPSSLACSWSCSSSTSAGTAGSPSQNLHDWRSADVRDYFNTPIQ
jgi:hypothetical protein